jgi:hypothetical protein
VARHQKIDERKQRCELCCDLLLSLVAHHDEAKWLFDHPKRVLDFGPDAFFKLFNFIEDGDKCVILVERSTFPQAHC